MSAVTTTQENRAGQMLTTPQRLLRMLVLALFYFVLEMVGKLLVLVQIGFALAHRQPAAGVKRFAHAFSSWMGAFWAYQTYVSDDAPWPYRRWPDVPR